MRDPVEVITTTADMIERIKKLLEITDDRLRLSRLQLERSRRLIERFVDFENKVKRRSPQYAEALDAKAKDVSGADPA